MSPVHKFITRQIVLTSEEPLPMRSVSAAVHTAEHLRCSIVGRRVVAAIEASGIQVNAVGEVAFDASHLAQPALDQSSSAPTPFCSLPPPFRHAFNGHGHAPTGGQPSSPSSSPHLPHPSTARGSRCRLPLLALPLLSPLRRGPPGEPVRPALPPALPPLRRPADLHSDAALHRLRLLFQVPRRPLPHLPPRPAPHRPVLRRRPHRPPAGRPHGRGRRRRHRPQPGVSSLTDTLGASLTCMRVTDAILLRAVAAVPRALRDAVTTVRFCSPSCPCSAPSCPPCTTT